MQRRKSPDITDKETPKSVKKTVGNIVTIVLSAVLIAVFIAFVSIMIQVGQGKTPSLFNRRFYYIVTDSMTPNINVGDVILSKTVTADDTEQFTEGAVITYTAESGVMQGKEVTHRIVEGVHFDESLNDYVVLTKGDKPGAKVDDPVRISRINAVMVKKSPLISWFLGVFKSGAGFALIIALPLGVMLVCLVVKLIMTIKAPAEENKEQTDAERIEEIKKKAVEDYIRNNSEREEK